MDRKTLVIGASGLIGSSIYRHLQQRDIDVVGTCYNQRVDDYLYLDLDSPGVILHLMNMIMPSDIYLCAAITNVDECEINTQSYRINVSAVKQIVEIASRMRSRIIFISSSYVFDGTSKSAYTVYDKPMPINQYGLQKMLAERAVLGGLDKNMVVRTVGVFGDDNNRKNFGLQVLDALNMGKTIYAPSDQYMNPILADDLSLSVVQAADIGHNGVLHVAGSDMVSKYDFALDIARACNLPSEGIVPVTKLVRYQRAPRPANACLHNTLTPKYPYAKSVQVFADAF